MSTKVDLEKAIGEIATAIDEGFVDLGATLSKEIEEVVVAISSGGDTSESITALNNIKAGLATKFAGFRTDISNVVTLPSTPAPEV